MTLRSNHKTAFAFSALAIGIASLSVQAHAAGIQGITAIQSSDANTELRIAFDGVPTSPVAYQQVGSNQLILDFNQVSGVALPRVTAVNTAVVGNVTAVSDGTLTRLVIDLLAPVNHSVRVEGNQLVVDIMNASKRAVQPAEPNMVAVQPVPTDVVSVQVNPLLMPSNAQKRGVFEGVSAINYTPNSAGGGDVVIALTNESIPLDIQRQGKKVIVRTTGAIIPKHLINRITAGGLIESIHTNNQGQNGIITITMSDDYEYQAYQTGSQLTVSVKPAKMLREPTLEEKTYTGQLLSMEFQDVPVRTAIDVIMNFTNQNVAMSDSVGGNLTLRLFEVPADQAIDIILKLKNLDKRTNGNVTYIAPATELAEAEAAELKARAEVKELLPLRTEFIHLSYANADKVLALLQNAGTANQNVGIGGTTKAGLISSRGSVVVDSRTNTLIITDTSDSIDSIRAMIEKIDIPVSQVMIEARIVSANDRFAKELGVNWGVAMNRGDLQVGGSSATLWDVRKPGAGSSSTGRYGRLSGTTISRPGNLAVDLGAAGPTGRLAFGLLSIADTILDLELSAMQADNRGEVISSPKVLTADKQKARISSGQQIAYQEATASGATSTSFKEAALVLEVTPNITPDGKIGLELSIKNGAPVQGGAAIQEDSVQTNVMLEDGQTVVLGGVYRNTVGNNVRKVPFLGDLPYVGRLFQNESRVNTKDELLIFITPKLVNSGVSQVN